MLSLENNAFDTQEFPEKISSAIEMTKTAILLSVKLARSTKQTLSNQVAGAAMNPLVYPIPTILF